METDPHRGAGGLTHGRVLHGGIQEHRVTPALPRRLGGPRHGQVGRLGAARREDDVARVAAEEGGHLVAGLLEQAPRPLGRRVAAGRVAECAGAGVVDRRHGGRDLGPERRGGGVVEIGEGAHRHGEVIGTRAWSWGRGGGLRHAT